MPAARDVPLRIIRPMFSASDLLRTALRSIGALTFLYVSTSASAAPASHLGQVATRSSTSITQFSVGSNKYLQTRSGHVFPAGATSFQVVLQGWFGNGNGDKGFGADTSVLSVELEYPARNCTTVTFSGASKAAIPNGGELISDPIRVNVAPGDTAWIYIALHNATALGWGGNDINPAIGDAMNVSASPIAHVPCGPVTTNISANQGLLVPSAIVAQTTRPSICIIGDSIGYQRRDTTDRRGDAGYIARSIGSSFGYINQSISGSQTLQFTSTTAPRRIALAKSYCTHVLSQLGINNLEIGKQTAAQVQSGLETVYRAFSPLPIWQTTLLPASISEDGFRTTHYQRQRSYGSDRLQVNSWIRSKEFPGRGFFDPNTIAEPSPNSGLWCAGCTEDGLHPNHTGTMAIVSAKTVAPSAFIWPPR